jgi:hypothetical protein
MCGTNVGIAGRSPRAMRVSGGETLVIFRWQFRMKFHFWGGAERCDNVITVVFPEGDDLLVISYAGARSTH